MKENKTVSQRFDFEIELIERIDDYRYENRIPTRKQAVKNLISLGLSAYKVKKEANERLVSDSYKRDYSEF